MPAPAISGRTRHDAKGEVPANPNPPERRLLSSVPPPDSRPLPHLLFLSPRCLHLSTYRSNLLPLQGFGDMAVPRDRDMDGGIGALPEECISLVLSLTSPRDACRSAAVSPAFLSASESDLVWGSFLPSDCDDVFSLSASPSRGCTKKELYLRLCDSLFIDEGKKIFALDRSTGRKRYTLSARDLEIVWGDTPHYWRWISLPESRFGEVAELLGVCWLEIRGKIRTRMLSPKTTYAAYLIFKLGEASDGLTYPNQEATVKVGTRTSKGEVCLHPLDCGSRGVRFRRTYGRRPPPPPCEIPNDRRRVPSVRDDGWKEILIGEFFNDGKEDAVVDMSVMETEGGHWKGGLIVEGIEVRPKT